MDRKAYLLSSLKKQVLHLKDQLTQIEKNKKHDNRSTHNRSVNESSSRFNSNCMDSTYLDRGVKKFHDKENKYKNIA